MTDRVTLIRLHSLGDVVLAQPAASALAAAGPVLFVTSGAYVPVAGRMPGRIEPVGIPVRGRRAALSRVLHSPDAGRIVDLQGSLTVRLALFPRSAAGRFRMDRAARRRVLAGAGSMPLRSRDFAAAAGVEAPGAPVLDRKARPEGGALAAGIVIGGRWPMKSLPCGVAAETARLLHDLYRASVVLLGGAGDAAEGEAVSRAMGGRPHTNATGSGDVADLIGRIERLDVLVSPDSGPAHLAAALGVPVVVVFTSTSPALGFWPEQTPGALFAEGISCRPCHRHGGSSCLRGTDGCRNGLLPLAIAERAAGLAGR